MTAAVGRHIRMIADVATEVGAHFMPDDADTWLKGHAAGDTDPDDLHHLHP